MIEIVLQDIYNTKSMYIDFTLRSAECQLREILVGINRVLKLDVKEIRDEFASPSCTVAGRVRCAGAEVSTTVDTIVNILDYVYRGDV